VVIEQINVGRKKSIMRIRLHYKIIGILFCLLLGLTFGGVEAYHFLNYRQSDSQRSGAQKVSSTTPQSATSTVLPVAKKLVRLIIPAIGVNAPVEAVGVVAGGYLGVPTQNQWDGVGWYKAGPYPGDRGSAVIDGHLDRPGGGPAVFWNLRDLRMGEMVMVVDSTGKTLRFRVTDMEDYSPQNAPTSKIFSDTSGSYLNLITCAGEWIPSQHQTALRLVVYTVLVP
jgi:LPXTG-site transpeptidase (sortase) family protein